MVYHWRKRGPARILTGIVLRLWFGSEGGRGTTEDGDLNYLDVTVLLEGGGLIIEKLYALFF